jgi:hypothetical protein
VRGRPSASHGSTARVASAPAHESRVRLALACARRSQSRRSTSQAQEPSRSASSERTQPLYVAIARWLENPVKSAWPFPGRASNAEAVSVAAVLPYGASTSSVSPSRTRRSSTTSATRVESDLRSRNHLAQRDHYRQGSRRRRPRAGLASTQRDGEPSCLYRRGGRCPSPDVDVRGEQRDPAESAEA